MKIPFEKLNLATIDDLHGEFLVALDELEGSDLTLDLENIKSIDLPAIQLILSLKKYCETNKINFKIENLHSKSTKQTLTLLQLKKVFGV